MSKPVPLARRTHRGGPLVCVRCDAAVEVDRCDPPADADHSTDGTIVRTAEWEWFVASRQSAPGSWWRVWRDADGLHCGCPHGRRATHERANATKAAVPCFHMTQAVAFEINRNRALYPLPVAEPNVAALVD